MKWRITLNIILYSSPGQNLIRTIHKIFNKLTKIIFYQSLILDWYFVVDVSFCSSGCWEPSSAVHMRSRGQCSSWWSSWHWRRIPCRKLPDPPACLSAGHSGRLSCRSRQNCSCTSSWSHPQDWRTGWRWSRPHWPRRSGRASRHSAGFWWSESSKENV